MVKSEWSVVQCTTCEKLNRIPGDEKLPENVIRLNDNLNHFDLKVPYVFGILTCPFCQIENKFRRDADHVVCYKCHNSFTIEEAVKNNNNTSAFNGIKPSLKLSSSISIPSDKPLRYSDLFHPDPMNFRGYYPQPYFFNQCDCSGTEKLLKKILKKLDKPVAKPKPKPVRKPDLYGPLRRLVRDIDDINERSNYLREQSYNNNAYNKNFGFDGRSLENYKYTLYNEVESGNNNNFNNYNRLNMSNNYSSLKNEAVYKTLFNKNSNVNQQFSNNRYSYF